MLDRSDPERPRHREDQKLMMDGYWRLGWLSDATYLRSIMLLGYGDRDARTELSLLRMEKNQCLKSS